MSSVAVRRFATAITAFALSLSGLVFSPAQANVPVNGSYSCATGLKDGVAPRYTITTGSVSSGTSCTGAVVLPNGVTGIAFRGFFQAANVTSITIPATVTSIGQGAFDEASKITTITIPASVTSIGEQAFRSMALLETVTFESGSKVTAIGDSTFQNSPKLTTVSFGTGSQLASIGIDAFKNTALTSITIPANVTTISRTAFNGLRTLTTVTFEPESKLTTIGDAVFQETGLASIAIPASVTSIGDSAFRNSNELFAVLFMRATAPTVGGNAFLGVGGGATAYIKPGAIGFGAIGTTWNQLVVAESETLPPANGFYSCATGVKDGDGGKYQLSSGIIQSGGACTGTVTVLEGAQSIGPGAFRDSALTSINMATSVKSIGAEAFKNSGLTSITIPAGVTSIGQQAFFNIQGLTTVTFGSDSQLKTIGNYAFYSATSLTSITIPAGVTSIGEFAFYNATSLTSITIPAGVTNIQGHAFFNMQALTSIVIPAGVTSIGQQAFRQTKALTSIVIPAGVTSIGQEAFEGSSALRNVIFQGTVAPTVGGNAFSGVSPGAVASIKSGATGFGAIGTQWNQLVIVDVDNPPPADGSYSCATGVKDGPSPTFALGSGLIAGEGGKSCIGAVVLPEGMYGILNAAFAGAPVTSISIPASLTVIQTEAFFDTNSLTSFTVAPANPDFSSIDGVLFNKNASTLLNYPTKKIGNAYSIPAGVNSVANRAFRKATTLTSVTIPDSVTSIGAGAFSEASNLASVTFAPGSKLTSIGAGAFGQTAITSINIPEGVTSIGDETFAYARQLTFINIAASVTSIGPFAFQGTVGLETINFAPDSQLTSIGNQAFISSAKFKSITIPANVTSIGRNAFQDTRMQQVTFEPGSKLASIGEEAFYESKALKSISIPASVTSIGARAFATTNNLAEIIFLGETAPTVGNDAFMGVPSSAKAHFLSYASGFGTPGSAWNGLNVSVGFYEGVSFDSKGGSIVAAPSHYGVITAPTAPTRAGYVFVGWSARNGGATITFPHAPSETSGITLFAKWNKIYTVTYVYNGATSGNTVTTSTTGSTNTITLPTPTRPGFTFDGWYSDAGLTQKSMIGNAGESYTPIGAAIELRVYAKWKQDLKAAASTKPSVTGKAIATAKGTNKLTANNGKWTGYPTPAISYQWYSCTAQVKSAASAIPKTCKSISKATTSTLAVTNSFKGKYLAVAVTGIGAGTSATTWLSKSTAEVK